MATAHFSEFSYGFAYTREVVETCWGAIGGAPTLPSLFDEGKVGGFDVSLGLLGWTYFAQFKRADFLSRSNARWWVDHGGSYFRFPITRRRYSRQHDLLLALQADQVFHIVEYVAPRFHTAAELSENFSRRSIIDSALRIYPRSIGRLDDEQHFVSYTKCGDPVVRSEPLHVESLYNAGALLDWMGATNVGPSPLTSEYFDWLSERLIGVAVEVGVAVEGLLDDLREMSAFGRARTLGRLLVGAEMIPIVARHAPYE